MRGVLKTILASIGAFFLAIIFISLIIALLTKEASVQFGDKVAVVEVDGIITDPTSVNDELRYYGERADVKAIIIRINSPGGGVGPSQEIYSEIKRLRETKKVVASMGAVAASGGYYIAAAADKIVANPGTITGSIGVIIEFVNVEDLLKKIGLKGYTIKSGRFKDIGSPIKEMEPEEKELLQEVVNDVYGQFVEAVSSGRNIPRDKVEKIADGRILSGAQAKKAGLVDSLGTLQDAITIGASLAGIKGKPVVIYPERRRGIWRVLFEDSSLTRIAAEFMPGIRIMYLLPDLAQ
ncbi:MAG TPA: signal peptide peptidase SppA [Thermodesulfobacteriota bacterium]|nr:signal peptide peptidase SppA [Thermodesulfobacteriota bacterium]